MAAVGLWSDGSLSSRERAVGSGVVPLDELSAAADQWAKKVTAASPLAALSHRGWPFEVVLATRYEPIETYGFGQGRLEGRAASATKQAPQW